MMRSARSEHILLAALLAVPLAVAFLVWPAFVRWAVGPSPQPTPEVAGATSVAAAPTPRPTVGAPPTIASRATTVSTATPVPTAAPQTEPTPAPAAVNAPTPQPVAGATGPNATVNAPTPLRAAPGASDPSAAVEDFYARVAAHDFSDAATLWSPRMRAAFPPAQNIDQRFSGTRALTVQRAQVVSQSGNSAVVAVDLDEAATDGQHHWSGTWSLVRGPDGWLLDQPQLQGA